MERVKANQRHISSMHYCWDSKLMRGLMSSVTETPEIVLARENTKKISDVQYREQVGCGTAVMETPEMKRVRRNQENISSVKYQRGLQEVRGRSCTELDTPEYRRVRRSQDSVSMAKYHEDFERARGRGYTPGLDEPGMERYQRANHMMTDPGPNQVMDTDRRPGGIIVAPVLPGAYHQGVHMQPQPQYHGYMHQTSMSSVRSVTSPPHSSAMRVYRALYDYAAQDHDEVSFRDGDVIVNAQPIDEGWMYGTVQRTGKSGMLPANYVECCN
uniref:SH3 domain-containing protein n=1 Tax=Hippocampus comes TaxID=109280 RepID=A0A3Q2XZ05_HIPCM